MHLRKMVSTFHKDHLEKPIATPTPLDFAPSMAKPTIQLPTKRKQRQLTGCAKKKHVKWGNKKEAPRKRQQGEIRVSVILKPEAGRRPEICLSGVESVGEPAVTVWPLAVWLLKNYTTPYFDPILHHPSPSSSKSLIIQVPHQPNHILPLSTNLGFSFSILSPCWKVFSSTISILYDLSVFLPVPLISWEVFHWLISYPVFLLSFSPG